MRKNLKWITVLCSTSAALLLGSVVSGGSTSQAFASSGGDSSTEVQYQKQTSVNESTNVDHAAKVEQYNESKASSTTSSDGTTTTTTYDSHPTNNQIGGTTADSSSVADGSQNANSSSSSADGTASTGDSSAAANQSSANKNGSSTGDGFAMVGAGKSGSAATGSTVEKGVKPVIDQLLPGGSLADSTPTVNQPNVNNNSTNNSSTTAATQSPNTGSGNSVSQAAASQYLSQRGLGQVNGNSKKGTIKSPLSSALEISNNETAAKNKTKLVSLNAFSNALYKKVQQQKANSGKIVPASGQKATITTPTKNVRYSTTGQGATTVSESMPVIVTLSVIGLAVLGFIAFDPLRFIFR